MSAVGSLMGLSVGRRCIGAAVAGVAWDGAWRDAECRHEEAFPKGARYVRRIDCSLRAASDLVNWARSKGVTHAWLDEPVPEADVVSHIELASVLVAECVRADIIVVAAGLPAEFGRTPDEVRQRLLEQGAPDGVCLLEYVALAMLGAGWLRRNAKAERLQLARERMPSAIGELLTRIER